MRERFIAYPLLMQPCFSSRPWGGRRLCEVLEKKPPVELEPIGESWELSDHPDGRSSVANGPYAGQLFSDLARTFPREIYGCENPPDRYPMMIKYIDAAEDLSIQVHPNDAQAAAMGDRGKNECWFVIDCKRGARIIHGLAEGVDGAQLRRAAESGTMGPSLRWLDIKPGDFIEIPARTVHAILAGTLICEIQQSSNTTYRLWDWDRQPPRTLHIEEACRVARYGGEAGQSAPDELIHTPDLAPGDWHPLLSNPFFAVRMARWAQAGRSDVDSPNRHGQVLNVVKGGGRLRVEGTDGDDLRLGQTWFLPPGIDRWRVEAGSDGLCLLESESLELE